MVTGRYTPDRLRLQERRETKRRKRGWNNLKFWWRSALGASIFWGVWQLANSSFWYLYSTEQIRFEGEQLIPEAALKASLDLPFPQYIFKVEPKFIADQLKANYPLADVEVGRRLFPAQLVVRVQERIPVAVAMYQGKRGYVDGDGVWIPVTSYQGKLKPNFTIVGFSDQVSGQWPELFQILSHSPVKVKQINWLDANNLVLDTELGAVHCGQFDRETFAEQINLLDRMRQLPKQLDSSNLNYLDLRNVELPAANLRSSLS